MQHQAEDQNPIRVTHKVLLPRQVLVRLLLPVLTLLIVGLSLFEPRSLNFALAAGGGHEALASLIVLAGLSVLALADVVINDVMPPRFELSLLPLQRRRVFAGMGCLFAMYSFILVRQSDSAWLAAQYSCYAVGCLSVAWRDLKFRVAQ